MTNLSICACAVRRSEEVRLGIVSGVSSGSFAVVCPGVTSEHLPGLAGVATTNRVNRDPVGPHPIASFEVGWE